MSGVYIIKCHQNYKIGIARNPYARAYDLQIGSPYQLEIIFFHPVEDARLTEHFLHKYFSHCSIGREWFSLDDSDLEQAKYYIQKDRSTISSCLYKLKNSKISWED